MRLFLARVDIEEDFEDRFNQFPLEYAINKDAYDEDPESSIYQAQLPC